MVFSYFSSKTNAVVLNRRHFLMSTHNTCFRREIRKYHLDTLSYLELCKTR